MGPLSNRVKVQIYFYGLPIEMDNFAFDVKVIQGLESTLLGGWDLQNYNQLSLS